MANRERGEMTLATPDRVYVLKLTTNAICDLEDRSGEFFDLISARARRGKVKDLRWMLWAALQEYHATEIVDPKDAGRVMDAAGGLTGVIAQIETFLTLNQDDSPDRAETPKRDQKDLPPDPSPAQDVPAGVDSMLTLAGPV